MNKKLGRKTDHRDHLLRNLLTSLVLYEKVDTTKAKSKILKSNFDRLISRNKKADLVARKNLLSILFDRNAVIKVIDELIPRYQSRQSGFVKSYNLKPRNGDCAPMTRLELIDKKVFVEKSEAKNGTAETSKLLLKTDKKIKPISRKSDKTDNSQAETE